MAPRHKGETLTPAVLDRILYRPNSVGGSGAGVQKLLIVADGLLGLGTGADLGFQKLKATNDVGEGGV